MTPFIKKALANTSWLVSEKVISMSANLLVSLALARSLGPEGFGVLSYLIALVALVAPLAALGLNAIITRELVNDPASRDKIIASATIFRLFGACAGSLFCVLLAINGWGVSSETETYGLIFLAVANIFHAFNVLEFWFQAQVAARQVARMRLTVLVLFAGLKLLAVAMSANLLTIIAIFAAETTILGCGFILIYSYHAAPIKLACFNFSYGIGLLKQSYWLILSGIAAVIYLKVDQVMLENMVGTEAVGVYAVAARLSEVWYFFADAVVITLFPALLKLKKSAQTDSELPNSKLVNAYQFKLQQISDLLFMLALTIAIIVSLVAKPVILFLFGQEYIQSVFILQLHIWAGLFIFMRALVSKWLLSEHLLAFSLVSHGLGAVINIIANVLLIPQFGGEGAAIATVLSYFIASYIAFWISPRTRSIARIMSQSLLLPFTLGRRYWPKNINENF